MVVTVVSVVFVVTFGLSPADTTGANANAKTQNTIKQNEERCVFIKVPLWVNGVVRGFWGERTFASSFACPELAGKNYRVAHPDGFLAVGSYE